MFLLRKIRNHLFDDVLGGRVAGSPSFLFMDDAVFSVFLNGALEVLYLSHSQSETHGRFFVGTIPVNAGTNGIVPLPFGSSEFDFFHGIGV